MSGMDRLTDEALEAVSRLNPASDSFSGGMARELLAHRRASQAASGGCGYPCGYDCNGACFQAAPAPSETCTRCMGNGEIVTDWDAYLHPPNDATEDAVADCPDCGGTGHVVAAPAPSDGTCAECGCAPTNAAGLCATCVDERAPAPYDGLREAAMTDRDEVAKKLMAVAAQLSVERFNGWTNPLVCDLVDAARTIEALRERAEAAEAECARLKNIRSAIAEGYNAEAVALEKAVSETLTAQLTEARRAEAAAWNDAIEAAAGVAEQYRDCWPRAAAPDAQYELKQEYLHMAYGAKIVGEQVRALRRAAPTEGEA